MKKNKWTPGQISLLLDKTKSGSVRMHAFDEIARKTMRKPNSVRNFYYKLVAREQPIGHEKNVFIPFDAGEIKNLLREIVLGTSRGESVRGICMRLASGDKGKMLRYQNKYRSIAKNRPHEIEQMVHLLEAQGFLVKSPVVTLGATASINQITKPTENQHNNNIVFMKQQSAHKNLTDADINNLFAGLLRLVKRQAMDEQKSQIDSLRAEIERLKSIHKGKVTRP